MNMHAQNQPTTKPNTDNSIIEKTIDEFKLDHPQFGAVFEPYFSCLSQSQLQELSEIRDIQSKIQQTLSLTIDRKDYQQSNEQQDLQLPDPVECIQQLLEQAYELWNQLRNNFENNRCSKNYIAIHSFSNYCSDLNRTIGSLAYELQDNPKYQDKSQAVKALAGDYNSRENTNFKNLETVAIKYLHQQPEWDWMIDAIAITPFESVEVLPLNDLDRIITSKFEKLTPRDLSEVELSRIQKLTKFCLHLCNFTEKVEEYDQLNDSFRLDDFNGLDQTLHTLAQLAHRLQRWVFFHPETRPLFKPIIKLAREKYLKIAQHTTEKQLDCKSSFVAIFVETALIYEREAVRFSALNDGNVAALDIIGSGWGAETCTKATGNAAGRVLKNLVNYLEKNPDRTDGLLLGLGSSEEFRKSQAIDLSQRIIERVSFRTGLQGAYLNEGFFNSASPSELNLWIEFIKDYEQQMSNSYSWQTPVTKLHKQCSDSALMNYFSQTPNDKSEPAISLLTKKLNQSALDHILTAYNGEFDTLIVFAKELETKDKKNLCYLSNSEIRAASNHQELNQKFKTAWLTKFELEINKLPQQINPEWIPQSQATTIEAHLNESLNSLPDKIRNIISNWFDYGTGLPPEALQELLGTKEFKQAALGFSDTKMLLPISDQEGVIASSPVEDLLRLFSYQLFSPIPVEVNEDASDIIQKRALVKAALLNEAQQRVPLFTQLVEEQPAEISQQLESNFDLQESIWEMIIDPEFQAMKLTDILTDAKVEPELIELKICAKSDPDTWIHNLLSEDSQLTNSKHATLKIQKGTKVSYVDLVLDDDDKTLVIKNFCYP